VPINSTIEGSPIAILRRHRVQANAFNVRRASFKDAFFPGSFNRCENIQATFGAGAAQASVHNQRERVAVRYYAAFRRRFAKFFKPRATLYERVARYSAEASDIIQSLFRSARKSTAFRCAGRSRSSARSSSGASRVREGQSPAELVEVIDPLERCRHDG